MHNERYVEKNECYKMNSGGTRWASERVGQTRELRATKVNYQLYEGLIRFWGTVLNE